MRGFTLVASALALVGTSEASAQVVFSDAGPTAADISSTVDAFRSGLGPLNPNVVGSFDSGRREINWDGVPDALSAPSPLPASFFNVNSPRGVVLSTPGTGFQVSASGDPAFTQFGTINPTYPQLFTTFSAQRIFTALDSNIVDINFFIPGTSTPAFVTGFGSVFTDVDLANSTTLGLFGAGNVLLGTYAVPSFAGSDTLSFLGVLFSDPLISRVRITSGNAALGPGVNETGGTDLVAMDDFIFGEPTLRGAVPEPASWAMMLIGFGLVGGAMRAAKRQPKVTLSYS